MFPTHPNRYLTNGTKSIVRDANTITNGPRTERTTVNALIHTVLANLRKEKRMKVEVIVDSNREDIKCYLEDILKEMKDHDEVNDYRIRELGGCTDGNDGKNRVL